VTKPQTIDFPRFYITTPAPCPYVEGRFERKIFTRLRGAEAAGVNDALTQLGFRRSQNIVYRPACDGCSACVSVRVVVDAFVPNRSLRRVWRRNADLVARPCPAEASREQFALLRRYLDARHADGGMAEMDALDYRMMVEDSPVETTIVEFRERPAVGQEGGRLVAACLTDIMSDGLSMVYSFFAPDQEARSLGSFMVLWHAAHARARGLPYVYLGYWVADCQKMSYKTRFQPLERLTADGWVRFEAAPAS
jgi:arginine-tRNA-protein transferase